jgi:ribose 5-phosphate isomerase A
MVLGLGSGSTATHFIELLGERLRMGLLHDILGVPTSDATRRLAEALGIRLISLADCERLDLAVDGADEVDAQGNLIKGLGRALLREKIVEIHARRFLVLVEESKLVERLGRGPLPVELTPFGVEATMRWLERQCSRLEPWLEPDGSQARSDNGNLLAKCWFAGGIADPYDLQRRLNDRPGVVAHGLFLDMAHEVIVAGQNGVRSLVFDRQA